MDLGTLLGALNQGFETSVVAQVDARIPAPSTTGTNAATQATGTQTAPGTIPLTGTTPQTGTSVTIATATGTVTLQPGVAPTFSPQLPGVALQPGTPAQGGASVQTQPGGLSSFQPTLFSQPASPAGFTNSLAGGAATQDVYYGAEAPATASLLAQSGVGAYVQLVNVLSSNEVNARSANALTQTLAAASTALKFAFTDAVSRLPVELQQKDWGFSISNGALVFTPGADELTPQDIVLLQKAFAAAEVELAAHQVATALGSIEARQKSGEDTGTLAWSRGESDTDSLNLRTFVNDTAPGGRYQPNTNESPTAPQIPNMLGGMNLSGLASAKPNFFHPDGSVITEEEPEEEGPQTLEDVATVNGQCACGEVRFTVENAFDYAFFCHCSRCRMRTGSVFAAIAGIDIDKVEVTTGADHLLIEGECADGYGARCRTCHSFLFAAVRERKYMHVSLGMITDTPNKLPDHHIYVGSKAPWYQITDSLPQYEELPHEKAEGRVSR